MRVKLHFIFFMLSLFCLGMQAQTLPDNIIQANCYTTPTATSWSIKEVGLNMTQLVHNYAPLTVGDIDGDGIIEIIGLKEDTRSAGHYPSDGVKIFYYSNVTNKIELKKTFTFSSAGGASSASFGGMAIARYNNKGYIVTAGNDKYLYAYDPNGTLLWKSDVVYHSDASGTILGIADFNNDGVPEVYTGNQIFSLSNGKKLCDGGTSNNSGVLVSACGHSTMAADMDGDGKLELVAGTQIYKVTITNNAGTAGNSISVMTGLELAVSKLPANALKDGATQVIDIDHDGKLEVVVLTISGGRGVAYVWKPVAGGNSYLMGSYLVPLTGVSYYSIPMIGNIDADKYPEIVFITNKLQMYALKFNPSAAAGSQISLKWALAHTDGSGCTGATLFDFNQDARNEIVYRDEQNLRIIDGSGTTAVVKATFSNVKSATLREFPIVADIDNDGQAEIVVTGGGVGASTTQNGYIRMFKTNGSPWAPARKVWNQYAYNAINVNNDLTIPSIQYYPAQAFPGVDGVLGTSDDVRPFNSFMQQQTMLDPDGIPIWLLPDASAATPTYTFNPVTKALSVSVNITNNGDAVIGTPVYVSLYKNSIVGTNKIATEAVAITIEPGQTKTATVNVPNISSYLPVNDLIVRINDDGTSYPFQPECDVTNGVGTKSFTRYNITYTYGTGGTPATNPTTYNELELPITLNNPTSLTGYTFTGWTGSNGSTPQTAVTIAASTTGNLNYTANYSVNNYMITYNLGGGTVASPGNPASYTVITPTFTLIEPTRPGYTFTGWTGSNGTTPQKNISINQGTTGNKTYTATWSENTYTITYSYAGGTAPTTPNKSTYKITETAFNISNQPTRSGYTFLGWTGSNGITPQVSVTVASGTTGDLSYLANWSSPNSYPITYNLDGGTVAAPGNPTTYDVTTPGFTLINPTKLGYTFLGWTGTGLIGNTSPVTIPLGSTGGRAYTANWSEDVYTIQYFEDDSVTPVVVGGNPTNYKITQTPVLITNQPTKTGYTFTGWTGSNGNTLQTSVTIASNSTGNKAYYAHWSTVGYTITYNLDGGAVASPGNPAGYNIETPNFTLLNPTKLGYTFTGWTETGGVCVPAAPTGTSVTINKGSITGNITYKANWSADPYTIAYNFNGGSSPISPNPTGYDMNDLLLAPVVISQWPIRIGWTFEGWTGANGTTPQKTVSITSTSNGVPGNLSYTANWTKNVYSITYNYDGGTAPAISNPSSYDVDDLPVNILNEPTKFGFTFAGWTGDNGIVPQKPLNLTLGFPTGMPKSLNFKAAWAPVGYNITYTDGNTNLPMAWTPTTYNITTPTFTLPNPTDKSVKNPFVGWTGTGIMGAGKKLVVTVPLGSSGDRAYTAWWATSFKDRYPTMSNDTLYTCEPPVKLSGDPNGIAYEWIHPDGTRSKSLSTMAGKSGRYILNTDYGDIIIKDTIQVMIAFEEGIVIERISASGPKINRPQQFEVILDPVYSGSISYQWTFSSGGNPASSTLAQPTVTWTTAGKKVVKVNLTVTKGGLTCSKELTLDLNISPKNKGFFVDQHVNGGNGDGSSWENAYRTLQEALSHAAEGDYIWVAKGVYNPDQRTAYKMRYDSIQVYGGFGAWEENLAERNFAANPTILRGNGTSSVIENNNLSAGARWDGFIIEGGRAAHGGGILNQNSSAVIANCIIRGNVAKGDGGGVYYLLGNPLLYNVEISGNISENGGGLYFWNGNAVMRSVTISGNEARKEGGGMVYEGGSGDIRNVIIYGNKSDKATDVANKSTSLNFSHSLIGGSGGSNKWNNSYGKDLGNNIDIGPLFKKNGFDAQGVMQEGNYQLNSSSRAVDRGSNLHVYDNISTLWGMHLESTEEAIYFSGIPSDLAMRERIQNDRVDMGAYEYGADDIDGNIQREILIPELEGLETNPLAGAHYVKSHHDFVFTIKAKPGYSLDYLTIKTGIEIRDKEGIRIVKNEDGSLTVTILQVTEPIRLHFEGVGPTASNIIEGYQVWSYEGTLYVTAPKEVLVDISTLSGQTVKQEILHDGNGKFELVPGVYVVTLDRQMTYKVVIK